MLGKYIGIQVIILGYCGDKILIRTRQGSKPVWVGKERVSL